MTYIVKECGEAQTALMRCGNGLLLARHNSGIVARDSRDHLCRNGNDAEGVLKSRMVRRGVGQLCQTELIYAAQALKKRRIYELKLPGVEHNRTPNAVVDDLRSLDRTRRPIAHTVGNKSVGAALKIKIKLT